MLEDGLIRAYEESVQRQAREEGQHGYHLTTSSTGTSECWYIQSKFDYRDLTHTVLWSVAFWIQYIDFLRVGRKSMLRENFLA